MAIFINLLYSFHPDLDSVPLFVGVRERFILTLHFHHDTLDIKSLSVFLYSILDLGHKIAFCPNWHYHKVSLNRKTSTEPTMLDKQFDV